jgi:two-component system, chemotaxis family, protein-glutamate methylesterase/glutaminase
MAGRDIIVVGASAGGVEVLSRLVGDLPEDLPAAVFIVLHISAHSGTALPRILDRRTKLLVAHPYNGEPIEPGRVYVGVPDRHLIVSPGVVRVANGPKENGHRPSVDTLFRTAAASYGRRVVGVVLSGTRDDGTAGLRVIRGRGGVAIVQHPAEALFPGMPQSAVAGDHPDWVVPVGEIGPLLAELAHQHLPDEGGAAMPDDLDAELQWAHPDLAWPALADPPLGSPSGFTCPECHGALWEIDDAGLPRYRCRVGHGFSADSLITTQRDDVEAALWTAYRALEERAALFRRLAERATGRHADITAGHFRADAADVTRQAEMLRALLWSRQAQGAPKAAESVVVGDESAEEPGT